MPRSMETTRIIEWIWQDLLKTPFDVERLAQGVIADCGVDTGQLTAAAVREVFEGNTEVNWEEISFAFDEVLAYYSVGDLDDEEFVKAIAVSLQLANAIERGHGDWEFTFDKVLSVICRNKSRGNFEFRMKFFRGLLST